MKFWSQHPTDKTTDIEPKKNSCGKRYQGEKLDWLMQAIVHIGLGSKIREQYREKFNDDVSLFTIQDIKKRKNLQPKFERIRAQYERGLAKEFLASKRYRISLLQEVLDIAMLKKDYRLVKEIIKTADDMMEVGKRKDMNVFQVFQQHNNYATWPIHKIREERARLLSELEKNKVETLNKENGDFEVLIDQSEENKDSENSEELPEESEQEL